MRIIINQLPTLGTRAGIGHYTAQLLQSLEQVGAGCEIDRYPTGILKQAREKYARRERRPGIATSAGEKRIQFSPTAHLRRCAAGTLRYSARAVTDMHFRRLCRWNDYDIYHEPNFIPMACDRPTVTTIHDLSVLLHPEWHPLDRVQHFERHFRGGLEQTSHFMAISEHGRQEIIRYLNIPSEQVTLSHLGIREGMQPMSRAAIDEGIKRMALPEQFLLHVGTIEPRKNLHMLMRAYCSLPRPIRESCPLLLVGSWGWNTQEITEYFLSTARHHNVLHLGYLSDDDLPILYNAARALVFPSLYEGFGLPPVEMMGCGGAVIASNAGAVCESVGDNAHLIHPEDEDGWYHALQLAATDDEWIQQVRAGGVDVARPFTWERCALRTLDAYRIVCGRRKSTVPDDIRRAA